MKIAPFFLLHRTTKSPRMRALIFRPPASRSFFSREPRGSFLIGRQRYRLILMALSRPSMAVCSSGMAAWRRGSRLLRKKRLFLRFARPFNRKITPFVLQVLRIVSFLLE